MVKLPIPTGWRILVKPLKPKEKTKGGIILADTSKEAEEYLNFLAEVISLGPLCYRDRETGKLWEGGAWCEVGDTVVIPKHSPLRMTVADEKYRLINDDEIIMIVPDPSIFKIYA